ncbi:hypothetical protein BU16DRAFT_559123 [Lophium mytilinum]|uniref:Uncharacterized protein n=1 Tax=Lophium mytilinum TaxID=390894 RepID=A0A6A6R0J8_9PEZI|nr:hypothetical protein BU16DRAFT_559123 [Lophium mytilinum]
MALSQNTSLSSINIHLFNDFSNPPSLGPHHCSTTTQETESEPKFRSSPSRHPRHDCRTPLEVFNDHWTKTERTQKWVQEQQSIFGHDRPKPVRFYPDSADKMQNNDDREDFGLNEVLRRPSRSSTAAATGPSFEQLPDTSRAYFGHDRPKPVRLHQDELVLADKETSSRPRVDLVCVQAGKSIKAALKTCFV